MADLSASAIMFFESAAALYGLFLAYYAFARGRIGNDITESDEKFQELLRLVLGKGKVREADDTLSYTFYAYAAGSSYSREGNPQNEQLLEQLKEALRVKNDDRIPDSWIRARADELRSNEAKIHDRYAYISAGLIVMSLLFLLVIAFTTVQVVWSAVPDYGGVPSGIAVLLLGFVPSAFLWVGRWELQNACRNRLKRQRVYHDFASLRRGESSGIPPILPQPANRIESPAYRTPRSAVAFAVVLVALVFVLFAVMFFNSGWLGILWGVSSLLFACLGLAGVYLIASFFTRTGRFAQRHSPGMDRGDLPLGMTRRGLAWGMLLVGSTLAYVGAGSAGVFLGAFLLPYAVSFVALAAVGAALIVASARILWRSPPNR